VLRIICSLLLMASLWVYAPVAAHAKKSKPNTKYASLVMDADSGVILSQRYADKKLHPASLTKMMTMMMIFEAVDRGDIRMNDRMRVSKRAASMVPSKLYLKAGSSIKVKDAIRALATKSANDVAVTVAEHLGGSEYRFANLMTQRARSIGMRKTRYMNASGLHHKSQVSTARDQAKLARYLLKRYPHHYHYFSTQTFNYNGKSYGNHNRLLKSYKGMDGFKTGYINASGFNLVASAKQNGRRLVGVVFGGRSTKSRNAHMASIMDAGFAKASKIRLASVQKPPKPPKKPRTEVATIIAPAANENVIVAANAPIVNVKSNTVKPDYTALSKALQEGKFGELAGQGDVDDTATKRIETGLIAIAAHKGDYKTPLPEQRKAATVGTPINPSLPHPKDMVGKWAVQIGAFDSRLATDSALQRALRKLPIELQNKPPLSVPLNTTEGTIFRARIGGLSEQEAFTACTYFQDCMPVAPRALKINAN